MTGLMGLLDKPAGVDWPEEEFAALKKEVNDAGLECTAKVYMNQSEFKYYTLNNPNTTTLVYRNRGNPHIL